MRSGIYFSALHETDLEIMALSHYSDSVSLDKDVFALKAANFTKIKQVIIYDQQDLRFSRP
jgi:hypothetical protein